MKTKIIFSIAIIFAFQFSLKAQENINELVSFAKAYGYVKYFHPSAEVEKIDWNRFSVHGAEQMLKCTNKNELVSSLNKLFKPIGPAISFSEKLARYNSLEITPKNVGDYKLSYWQHIGVSTGMKYQFPLYSSVMVNKISLADDTTQIMTNPIFDAFPKFGELIEEEIVDGLYCQIPLSLYADEKGSYPISQSIEALQADIESTSIQPTNLFVRLGNVINVYNVFQHFYPYFDVVDVDWDRELKVALKRCFIDRSAEDHLLTLEKFTASIRDGHLWVWQGESPYKYYPPIHWEWIQDSLVITNVFDKRININVGDVVSKVNKQTAKEYFEEVNSRISYGTESYLNYANSFRSLSQDKGTSLVLEINDKEITLEHNRGYQEYQFAPIKIQEHDYLKLDNDIMYINLGTIDKGTLIFLLPQLSQMKGIIYDFRGHNYTVSDFVGHFSKEAIPNGLLYEVPHIIYPDQKRKVKHKESDDGYEIKKPYLGDIKTVFITDGRTKSSSESFISTIKYSNLATIVGSQTAGANGHMNPSNILGDFTIWWTGAKVTNPDGSQFHCKGITPDVIVEKTIYGIRKGKDEFLEKAIEILSN